MRNYINVANKAIITASALQSLEDGAELISEEAHQQYQAACEELQTAMIKFFSTLRKVTEDEAERRFPGGRELLKKYVQERLESDETLN